MAFTIAKEFSTFGNKRVAFLSCSVDSSSGNIDTGLAYITAFQWSPISMTSMGVIIKQNIGSGATARGGIINIQSFTTGDVFFITAYGR